MTEAAACWTDLSVTEGELLPEWLQGAWIRRERDFPGCSFGEVSDVVWLQAGTSFVDVRLPRPGVDASHWLDEAHAFSGHLALVGNLDGGAVVTWNHDLDTKPLTGGSPDAGHVVIIDGELVESGDHYVEWWGHPAQSSTSCFVLEYRSDDGELNARLVAIDTLAVAVWGGAAPGGLRAIRVDGTWEHAGVLGSPPEELGVLATLAAQSAEKPLSGGWVELSVS